MTLDSARAALGASEEPGVLLAADTEALIGAVRGLMPHHWLTGSFEERQTHLLAIGIDGLDRVPMEVLRTIDNRAGGSPELALRFAAAALTFDGVFLRPQQSKNDPWYFQVRHQRYGQVVAYAHPRPGEVRIEFRLSPTNETYGLAEVRDSFYGVVLAARDDHGFDVAVRLLADALAQPPG